MEGDTVLEARGITKQFPGTLALDAVDFEVRRGEIHGLVGANGAGKSTLIKILAGVYAADGGDVLLGGQPVTIDSIEKASEMGLFFVHQQHVVVPSLNGVENVLLGQDLPTRGGIFVDWKKARQKANELQASTGFDVDLGTEVSRLSVANQKLLEIMRALARQAKIVFLDEPTASLGDEEAARLMTDLRRLADGGVPVVYISHRLEEILKLTDRITAFRNGANVGTVRTQDVDKPRLVELIVGSEMSYVAPAEERPVGAEVLSLENVSYEGRLTNVSLQLHAGEVVGLAGLQGAGRTEIAEIMFGVRQPDSGQVRFKGETVKWKSNADAIDHGIGMVPEDRHVGGLILPMSIARNITLPSLGSHRRWGHLPFLSNAAEAKTGRDLIDKLSILARGPSQVVDELSGGNQQKVVLAKWLARKLAVLILDEPTHGVDVGAKSEIYRLIGDIAAGGTAVLIIASELAELAETCDRVLAVCSGQITEEMHKSQLSEDRMLSACFGDAEEKGAMEGAKAS